MSRVIIHTIHSRLSTPPPTPAFGHPNLLRDKNKPRFFWYTVNMPQLNKLNSFKNLKLAFSAKADGNMSFVWGDKKEVLKNRKKFLKKNSVRLNDCVAMSLLHGTGIKRVTSPLQNHNILTPIGIKADCLVTTEKGIFIFMLTADCLPVIFYDPKQQILALAHISRKNTGQLFTQKIIQRLKSKFNCQPANLIISIGPGIHKESYLKNKVPEQQIPAWKNHLSLKSDSRVAIDLLGYNKQQMTKAGVQLKNIYVSNIDTVKSKKFFSHYRSQKTGEPEGRFATVVGMV